MWWTTYWPAPWMFVFPAIMFLFLVICIGAMMFIARRGWSQLSVACCGMGFAHGRQQVEHFHDENDAPRMAGRSAFDEYRADTLRRLEQEQVEFQGFLDHLRAAKDKVEFDQFMASRGTAAPAPESRPQA